MESSAAKIKPSPGVAAVLSFLFSGMGQIYNGDLKKGLIMVSFSSLSLVVVIAGAVLICYYSLYSGETADLVTGAVLFVAGVAAIAVLGIYSVYEAYGTANRKLLEGESEK